ncbi:uncharacterized protein DNG_06500 [Cephalotrichum gorgonifer]|uniref:GAT domain-containing protein n=1 Tax=Cephalotrichum gorgonifer TaxID=2041049 RepID=A0AAE8N0G8_9PEZI|nr:uncharacterized protein DNG_06500 [Cephalotrichum gorgonifer]
MKGLGVNKVIGTIKRRTTGLAAPSAENASEPTGESPEAIASNAVQGDEVLFLPTIVDAAESSPAAAAECARLLRKYLVKSYTTPSSTQYNAVMLVRILTDNPGPTFTRNLDKKFVDTVKELLKHGRDRSVLNLLMETLDTFEFTKSWDEGLTPLIEMWKKEKLKNTAYSGPPRPSPDQHYFVTPQPRNDAHGSYSTPSHHHGNNGNSSNRLPDPDQLASRLEEATTSAKLLTQFITNSTAQELLENDLVKEFASRCQSASKSVQGYMAAENPAPDHETMESLLDTNEQLQAALTAHHRAVLSAKKSLGLSSGPAGTSTPRTLSHDTGFTQQNIASSGSGLAQGSSSRSTPHDPQSRRNVRGGETSDSPPVPPRDVDKGKRAVAEHYDPPSGAPSGSNNHPDDPFSDPKDDVDHRGGESSFSAHDALAFDSSRSGFSAAAPYSSQGSGARAGGSGGDDDDIYGSASRR